MHIVEYLQVYRLDQENCRAQNAFRPYVSALRALWLRFAVFTKKQMESLCGLLAGLQKEFPGVEIIQHSDVNQHKPYCAGLDIPKLIQQVYDVSGAGSHVAAGVPEVSEALSVILGSPYRVSNENDSISIVKV